MPRTIASWMAVVAASSLAIAALLGPTDGRAVAILVIEVIGLPAAITWGIARRNGRSSAFAAGLIIGLLVVETPAVRRLSAIDGLIDPAREWIAPDRRGTTRLPRESFDESYSKWNADHPDRLVPGITLRDEVVVLEWVEPTSGPFRRIAGRLLALLPGALAAAIFMFMAWNRRRPRPAESRRCPD